MNFFPIYFFCAGRGKFRLSVFQYEVILFVTLVKQIFPYGKEVLLQVCPDLCDLEGPGILYIICRLTL